MLFERDYRPDCVNAAINRARKITRTEALKRVVRSKTTHRSVFAIKYDPDCHLFPNLYKNCGGLWRAEVFPLPPLVADKRQPNIRDK